MKVKLYISLSVFILILGFVLWRIDLSDRLFIGDNLLSKIEKEHFFGQDDFEKTRQVFTDNFEIYEFPKTDVKEIKLYSNTILLSRLTGNVLSDEEKLKVINFFNDDSNFEWGETTWSLDESEYIFRFYDEKGSEIAKSFIALDGIRMTKSYPFSPKMKFGGLSDKGLNKIKRIINDIRT